MGSGGVDGVALEDGDQVLGILADFSGNPVFLETPDGQLLYAAGTGPADTDPLQVWEGLRERVVTVAYYALVSSEKLQPEAHANAENVGWFCVSELPELAFDHKEIIYTALRRLQTQLENTNVAFQLLPGRFTLTELQRVYELILEKPLDKRNFRKKMLSSDLLVDTGETKMDGYHRPAQL